MRIFCSNVFAGHRRKQNGWWLFYKDASQRKVPGAGESKQACQKRIWESCLQQWRQDNAEGRALRRHWSLRARQLNQTDISDAVVPKTTKQTGSRDMSNRSVVHLGDPAETTLAAPYPSLQACSTGSGVLGLGDSSFAIAIDTVTNADETEKSFVKTFSDSWRSRTFAQIKPGPESGGTTRLSCFDDLGFCIRSIDGIKPYFQTALSWLRKLVADHRKRHLVDGKNKGPNARIRQPVLLIQ